MKQLIQRLELRFLDNWHKIGWVSRLMCKLGRHDFEARAPGTLGKWVTLECFYCSAKRDSHIPEIE